MARTCQRKPDPEKGDEPQPFYAMTGNPENGDYEDYIRHLKAIGRYRTSKKPIRK